MNIRLLAASLALACTSAAPPPMTGATQAGIPSWAHPEIVQVSCLVGAGSAFRVGQYEYLTVNHVSSLSGCFINGQPITVAYHGGDFAILTAPYGDKWLPIDCKGFVAGRKYHAIGYARGLTTLTEVDLTATGDSYGGFAILSGVFTVIPGMSGGVVLDAKTGAAVGTVNTFNAEDGLSGSVPLSDTPVCRS